MATKVAVVTGASKGLGYAVVKALCEKFHGVVYLTARNEKNGLAAVKRLNDLGLKPEYHNLDVTDNKSIAAFADFIKTKHGRLDVLVNNAAILEWKEVYPTYKAAKRNIETNYRSLLVIEQHLYPLLQGGARVVNVTSACGHLSNLKNKDWLDVLMKPDLTEEDIDNFVDEYLESVKNGTFDEKDFADGGKHAEHRVSKIALTALTMVQQKKYRNVSINAVNPGYMKTDMSHGGGEIDAEDAAKVILYLVLEASPNLKGIFMWDNKKIIDWYDYEGDYYCKGLW